MKYIEKVDEIQIYDDGTGRVDLWDFSRANENEESRVEAIATVASVCYNKLPNDAKKLVKRLWTESGGGPSSALEFIRSCYGPSIASSLRNNPGIITAEEWCEFDSVGPDALAGWHKEVIATFRVTVPIFVARQLLRHRSFSAQERSRRYTTDKISPLEWWVVNNDYKTHNIMAEIYEQEYMAYRKLLDLGLPAERARSVLGTGLYTTIWLQSDVPGLKNYFKLRLDKHTQKEHRELAQAMFDLLEKHQPVLYDKVRPHES